jgi:rsbT co-antagonist protein RsbR
MRVNLGEIADIRRETVMPAADAAALRLPRLIHDHETDLLAGWVEKLKESGGAGAGRIMEGELQTQCRSFLRLLRDVLAGGKLTDIQAPAFTAVRDFLGEISRSRAVQGFSPTETALFIFSLKEPIFALIQKETAKSSPVAIGELWAISVLIDQLGLYTMEMFQKSREEVIIRQQQEIAELSTPVVRLWDGVVALPLIGTLDSSRTQVVMENLLQAIVDQTAAIAIIDITGVPTVDTLVAQHLLKTIAAARLMGADCIISGIRPQIAQTMVHLGVELSVVSKASLADAFALALKRTGRVIVAAKKPEA